MTDSATELDAALAFALELADVADTISLARWNALDLVVDTKPDMSPVSDADRSVERELRTRIQQRYPGDTLLGEEYGGARHAGREWIIDPIDGTANFIRGVPVWATLIALTIDGIPVVGVVSAPAMRRRWWARSGGGAWAHSSGDADAQRLTVSGIGALSDAFVSYNGMSYWIEAGQFDALRRLVDASDRNRAFGDFWGYMLVAEGAIDMAGEFGVQSYDLAALDVIVREAGGRFGSLSGESGVWGGSALATNGLIHDEVLRTVAGG